MASLTFIKHLLFGLEIIGGQNGDYETFNAKWGEEINEAGKISRLNRGKGDLLGRVLANPLKIL
jgi:hypothetical protein